MDIEKKSLTVFKGKVIDAISRKPVAASIEIIDNGQGKMFSTLKSNSASGKFLLSLPAGKIGKLPVGLQIIGNHFEEGKILGVASEMEKMLQ